MYKMNQENKTWSEVIAEMEETVVGLEVNGHQRDEIDSVECRSSVGVFETESNSVEVSELECGRWL